MEDARPSLAAVCLAASGLGVAFGAGAGDSAGIGSLDVMAGFKASAGCRAIGGSITANRSSAQYLNQGAICLTFSGKAKKGRYGWPGSGLYKSRY